MKFHSIARLDTGILYLLELSASLSIVLLAGGLITSMANVLTNGSVLSDNLWMKQAWAWTQCVAIEASLGGTIIHTVRYYHEREWVKMWLYGLLSVLLLFTAGVVSTIEAIQQALNLTLDRAYVHLFVPIELLICTRSIAIVLLIVCHSLKHLSIVRPNNKGGVHDVTPPSVVEQEASDVPGSPQLSDSTQVPMIAASDESDLTTTVSDQVPQIGVNEQPDASAEIMLVKSTPPAPATTEPVNGAKPKRKKQTNTTEERESTERSINFERVKEYLTNTNPDASVREIARSLNIGVATANKWITRVKVNLEKEA